MNPAALSCPSAALFPFRKALEQHSEAPSLKNQHQPNASSVNVSPKCFRRLPPEYFFIHQLPAVCSGLVEEYLVVLEPLGTRDLLITEVCRS